MGSLTAALWSLALDTTRLTNGSHVLTATTRDAAGNSASRSITVNVQNVADTEAPGMAITSPVEGARVGKNSTETVSATDNVGVVKVEVLLDGQVRSTLTSAPYSARISTNKLAPSAHVLKARAYDAAGNMSESAPVTIQK
jgi:hypothetical protein